ncbi:trypsin-like peptidase domain-containing protein [Luteimicrobium sp. NPDC057192]|uniref:trypsin-like peptidase domain-containing protein n=1 Tax=Luteimicrobium sp. NPDC057192 TaxID=3346042 RepID=UPI00363A234B
MTEHEHEQQGRTPDGVGQVPSPPSADPTFQAAPAGPPAPPAPPFAPPQPPTAPAAGPAQPAPDQDAAAGSAAPAPAHTRTSRRVLAGSVAGALVVGALGGAGVTALVGGGQSAEAAGGSSVGSQVGGPGGSFPGQGTDGSGAGTDGSAPGQDGSDQVPSGPPDSTDGSSQDGSSQDGTGTGSGAGTGSADGTSTALEQTTATSAEATGVVVVEALVDGGRAESAGTGIVLTSGGEVVTNAHVVEGATEVRVVDTSTGTTYAATVTGASTTHDVAVLQLSGASGLATATLDTSDDLAVGDDVTAVGNSAGTGDLRAADGTVTALDRTITTAPSVGETSETLTGLIQVDADVVSGDSGGALLDAQGEVVGMTTAASTGTADVEGYAIDIEDALTVVHEILGETSTGVGTTAYVVLPGGELLTLEGARES